MESRKQPEGSMERGIHVKALGQKGTCSMENPGGEESEGT